MQSINTIFEHLQKYVKPKGIKILSLIGLLVVLRKIFRTICFFKNTFLYLPHDLRNRYGAGSWALITGGAQGIGAAFAQELASKGFNLILIDIKEDVLQTTATTLKSKFPQIQVKTLIKNFANSWQEKFFDSLFEEIGNLDISILVNNVGTELGSHPEYHEAPERDIINGIAINILPTAILTKKLIPHMLKREKKSAIINLSSITGTNPMPRLTMYSATKAFVDFFSRAVEGEVQEKIDVLSVRPSYVSTEMILNPRVGGWVISPIQLVRAVLSKMGKQTTTYGNWNHEVQGVFSSNAFLRNHEFNKFMTRMIREKKKILGIVD